jgi:hypothetical protein
MNWKSLLESRHVQPHAPAAEEIHALREVVDRDLGDAVVAGLSADRRFATAYNAALQLAKMAVTCAGYRVSGGLGHHQNTLDAVKVAIPEAARYADYFDACRRKRNRIDYEHASVATDSQAHELVAQVTEFFRLVEGWVEKNHPEFKRV